MTLEHAGSRPARRLTVDALGATAAFVMRRLVPDVQGRLRITLPSGGTLELGGQRPGPDAVIAFRRWHALWRLAAAGDLGLARGHIDGDCAVPDVHALLAFGAANGAQCALTGTGWWGARALGRLRHRFNDNSRRGSRRNVAAHYDLGNAFYRHWLDRGMSYSSARYRRGDETLEEAQEAKLDRVVELLELTGSEHVLEIGCGWGALAERLARVHGCRVTGLTLSTEQLAYARRRLADRIGQVDLRLQDYRDCHGRFDRIVSIEMLEAVGERYWPIYFDRLRACLREGGLAVLQVITIADARFEAYRRRPDFIQHHIFPGGMLPPASAIAREAERAGLIVRTAESFGLDYARTLAEWRRRFLQSWPAIQELAGFDARFRRLWDYYLAYCQVGFEAGHVDVTLYQIAHRSRPA